MVLEKYRRSEFFDAVPEASPIESMVPIGIDSSFAPDELEFFVKSFPDCRSDEAIARRNSLHEAELDEDDGVLAEAILKESGIPFRKCLGSISETSDD